MPEPTPPNPTPTPADPPAPSPATLETPLGFDNQHGWTKVADVVAAFNKANGALANPQAPEQYDLSAINQHWQAQGLQFNPEDDAFQSLAKALHSGGVSQRTFDKVVPMIQAATVNKTLGENQAWAEDAMTKVGGKDKLESLLGAADKAGLGAMARKATGDELVKFNNMLNAVTQMGGLNGPGGNPAGDPPANTGNYHPECQAQIGDQVVGIDIDDFQSFEAFKQLKVGADENGKGGRLFYQTQQGQQIYNKAMQLRAAKMRSSPHSLTVGGAPATA